MDFDRVMLLIGELGRRDVEYVVAGGVAPSFQCLVRATEDIDLFARPTRRTWRACATPCAVWPDPEIDRISAADLAGDYPTVRYGPPAESFLVDILGRLGTTFRFEDIEAETLEIEGAPVRVATPAMLFRMKRDTVRPIDRADALASQQAFDLERRLMPPVRFTSLDEARLAPPEAPGRCRAGGADSLPWAVRRPCGSGRPAARRLTPREHRGGQPGA